VNRRPIFLQNESIRIDSHNELECSTLQLVLRVQWRLSPNYVTSLKFTEFTHADLPTPTPHIITQARHKGSSHSITESRVPELIQWSRFMAVSLPLLSARPAVTFATLKRAATNFAAWWTQARWVWTVCLRLLPDSVAAAIWTQALLRLSPAR